MSDGSEKRPLTKMLWSVFIKTRTFASVNTSEGFRRRTLNPITVCRAECDNNGTVSLNI